MSYKDIKLIIAPTFVEIVDICREEREIMLENGAETAISYLTSNREPVSNCQA